MQKGTVLASLEKKVTVLFTKKKMYMGTEYCGLV